MRETELPKRPLPDVTPMNDYFWLGGKVDALHILHCDDCDNYIHPYAARCTQCGSDKLAPKAVSGKSKRAANFFTTSFSMAAVGGPPSSAWLLGLIRMAVKYPRIATGCGGLSICPA